MRSSAAAQFEANVARLDQEGSRLTAGWEQELELDYLALPFPPAPAAAAPAARLALSSALVMGAGGAAQYGAVQVGARQAATQLWVSFGDTFTAAPTVVVASQATGGEHLGEVFTATLGPN